MQDKRIFEVNNLHDNLHLVQMGSVIWYAKTMLSHITWKHFNIDGKLNFVFSITQYIFWTWDSLN